MTCCTRCGLMRSVCDCPAARPLTWADCHPYAVNPGLARAVKDWQFEMVGRIMRSEPFRALMERAVNPPARKWFTLDGQS